MPLPAAVAAGPAVTTTEVKFAAVCDRVHCNAAGAVPAKFIARFRLTGVPGDPEPDDKLRFTWEKEMTLNGKKKKAQQRLRRYMRINAP